jgi:Flp pilus assembly protein protease CpaA
MADAGLKVWVRPVDVLAMLVLLTMLTAGYFAVVIWLWRETKIQQATLAARRNLPAEDQPPASAIGWPPGGSLLEAYLEEGFRALDAFLAEGFAA